MDKLIDDTIRFLLQNKRSYILSSGSTELPLAVENPVQREELTPLPAANVVQPVASKPLPKQQTKKHEQKPLPERAKRPTKEKPTFSRTPLDTHATVGPDASMLSLLQEVGLDVTDTPLDDIAKKRRFAWKDKRFIPAVPIFTLGSEHLSFLTNLQKAIESHFSTSRVIHVEKVEKNQKWDAFFDAPVELFIVPDYVISQNATLMKNMRVQKENNTRTLFGKPLLLLPDLTLYMRDPKLKRSLWNVLCQMLQK